MNLAELAQILHRSLPGGPAPAVTAVTQDSRRVAPGAVFFAIAGEHVDGHDFAETAVARGAVATSSWPCQTAPRQCAHTRPWAWHPATTGCVGKR